MAGLVIILVIMDRHTSGDLHPGVEDLGDGPDAQGRADGEQAHEALRRHPHAAHVDALQPPALVHQRHQPGLRHVAAAPQDDALHMEESHPHHTVSTCRSTASASSNKHLQNSISSDLNLQMISTLQFRCPDQVYSTFMAAMQFYFGKTSLCCAEQ